VQQFVLLINRYKLYQHAPTSIKKDIPELALGQSPSILSVGNITRIPAFAGNLKAIPVFGS
jgi:hypothetical protein